MAWHLKSGPDLDQWLSYPEYIRNWIIEDVGERIDRHNGIFDDLE